MQYPQAPRSLATVESEFRKQDQPLLAGLEAALARIRARAAGDEAATAPVEVEPASVSPEAPTAAPPGLEEEPAEAAPPESHTVEPALAETAETEQTQVIEPAEAEPTLEAEQQAATDETTTREPEAEPELIARPATPAIEAEVVAPPAAAAVDRQPARGPEALPDQVQVIAYPFENFGAVNSFINAIRRIPDVRHVAPRRFRGGIIQLTVEYAGAIPLANHLQVLEGFEPRVVSNEGDTVSVAIGGR